MLFLLFIQICLAGVPNPVQLTLSEEQLVGSGELVVREGRDGNVTAVLDIPVPEQIVLEEIMNLPARVAEVQSIQKISIYRQDPGIMGGQWTVGMFGVKAQFHVLYTVDDTQGWITFRMDESRENELKAADGSYQTYRVNGKTRLVYRCDASPESAVPDWVREMISGRAMNQQIDGIKSRAKKRKLEVR